ncbi:unnamed protein product, partial [Meganyctiphanes norvegica]
MVQQTAYVVLQMAVVMVMLLASAFGLDSSRSERSLLKREATGDQHSQGHDHPSNQPHHHSTQHAQNQQNQQDGESLSSSADGVVNHWLYKFPPWTASNPAPRGFYGKSLTKETHAHTSDNLGSDVVISSVNSDGSHRTGRLENVKVPGNTHFQTEVVKTILDSELEGLKHSSEPILFTPSPSTGPNTFTPIVGILQPPTSNSGTTTALNSNQNTHFQDFNNNRFVSPPPRFDTVPQRFPDVDEGSTVLIAPEMQSFMPKDVFIPSNLPQNSHEVFQKPITVSQTRFNSEQFGGNRQPKQVISVTKSLSKSSDFRPSPLISISSPSHISVPGENFDYKISVTPYPLPDVPSHEPLPLYQHITKENVNTPSNSFQTSSHSQISHENIIEDNVVQGDKRRKPPVTYHPKGSADTLWIPFIPGIPLPILLQQAQRFSQPAGTRQTRYNANKKNAQSRSIISNHFDTTGSYPKSIQDIINSELDTAESLFRRGPQSSQQIISVNLNQSNEEK